MAIRYDIAADQGATLHLSFLWRQAPSAEQAAAGEQGTPVDLTGYQARMQLRKSVDAETASLDLTTANGRIILGATDPDATPDLASGLVTLWVDAATTSALDAGPYVYDVELVDGDFVTRFIEGRFKLRPEVTR